MHLFVYGTLRCSAAHPMHASLCAVASFVGEARVRGVRAWLYEYGWSTEGRTRIVSGDFMRYER